MMTALNKVLAVGILACGIFTIPSQAKSKGDTNKAQNSGAPIQPNIIVNVRRPDKTPEESASDQARANSEMAIKRRDGILAFVIAFAAVVQCGVAIWQGRIYRQQYTTMTDALKESQKSADAAMKGIVALEKIERPFLIIERRGDRKTDFWAVNCGKTPAQLIFINKIAGVQFPKFDQEMQDWHMPKPNYGMYYDDPRVQVINVEWIAPGKDMFINSFDISILDDGAMDQLKKEINAGSRAIRIFSAIKYRGLVSDEIFESRYCYGWGQNGTHLAGPAGYNYYS